MYIIRHEEEADKFEFLMKKIEDGDFDTLIKRYLILRGSPEFVLELLEEKGDSIEDWQMRKRFKTSSNEQEIDEDDYIDIDENLLHDRIITCVTYNDEIEFENEFIEVVIMIANEDSVLLQFENNSIYGFNKMYFSTDKLTECDLDEYLQMSCYLKYGETMVY